MSSMFQIGIEIGGSFTDMVTVESLGVSDGSIARLDHDNRFIVESCGGGCDPPTAGI